MLTRKKRIDSSPKPAISKNIHLLSREVIQDTVNVTSTPPGRRRFMLGNSNANIMNDDSPVLSQEAINISWKWNNETTPLRPSNKVSKLRRSISSGSPQLHSLQRLTTTRNGRDAASASTMSPKLVFEPETYSPKGLYKFQEEMRKIQFDTESDTLCDNINDKSGTVDTGYPTNRGGGAPTDGESSDNNIGVQERHSQPPPISQYHFGDDTFADDLLNDSDFDQILLTCQIPVQKEADEAMKKANSAPEIKASGNSSSDSNWNLIDDDCFDDLVKDFDVDIPSTLNTSAKFTRHKSMPQPAPKPTATVTKARVPQQSPHISSHINRKSFARHESMPITNTSIHRPQIVNNNNVAEQQKFSSTQTRKCTTEEIAEKRRIAMERLKNRKQNHN